MSIRIVVDDAELQRVQGMLGEFKHKAPNIIASAMNRSITNIKANVPKEVRKDYNVKAAEVKDTLKILKANASKLQAEVKSTGKVLGLDKYKVSPKTVNPKRKSQLKISIKKSNTKQILGSFIANINGVKVFKRDGKKRLPISRLMGPSVPQMIGKQEKVDKINRDAYVMYERRINQDINHFLSKMGAS